MHLSSSIIEDMSTFHAKSLVAFVKYNSHKMLKIMKISLLFQQGIQDCIDGSWQFWFMVGDLKDCFSLRNCELG